MIRLHDEIDGSGLPALIICPNSVKYHWAKNAQTWLPQCTPFVLDGSLPKKRKTLKEAAKTPRALVIVNIESVRLFSRLAPYGSVKLKRCRECDPRHGDEGLSASRCDVHLKELNDFNFRVVIGDEFHRIKDPRAQQTRAIWYVMHQDSVKYRWALTGTPIANHPGDLWSILHAVAPDEFPTKSKWLERYGLMAWNSFGGLEVVGIRPDTRNEFFRQLDPRFRRILKAVVLPQLPPKIRSTRYVDMSTAQARMYREMEKGLVTRTPDGQLLVASTQLAAHTRLMQLSSSSVKVTKPDPDDITTWEVELVDPSPKLDALEEILDELGVLAGGFDGPPVLVAAEHKQLINLAAKRLDKLGVRYALVTGDVSPYDRQKALDALRARSIRVLMFTNKAGGVGMDMSASDTLINLQRSWSLVDERQKEDRNHRIGSEIHECVRIIDVITRDTVEEGQITTLLEKLERLEEITRDRAALLAANPHALTDELDALEAGIMSRGLTNVPPLNGASQ
jgi:Superfamily II DNA/RNA helicases, SNF2 family